MKIYLKYNAAQAVKAILTEQLERLGVSYELKGLGEVEFKEELNEKEHEAFTTALKKYGIETITNQKSLLVQKIKDLLTQMVNSEENLPPLKISSYLADKLNYSPGYLSNLFSEMTHTSIENFVIMQKIERAKQLIINNELTLTQIAYLLRYSSVAHLSNQFKQTTGLSPTVFQRIISKRQDIIHDHQRTKKLIEN